MQESTQIGVPSTASSLIPAMLERRNAGQASVVTVEGVELRIEDESSYDLLLALIDRLEAIDGIRRGLESAERGEGRPIREFFGELRRKYRLSD